MPDRKPTPIRKRASARVQSEPKPLIIPQPARSLTVVPPALTDEQRTIQLVARLLYKIAARFIEPDIVEMGEALFVAECMSLMEDME